MKKLFLLFSLLILTICSIGQQNLVQVIASGDGKTKDESLSAALRHCIEKTFGVFVSSNTTVVNDSLINDNIATIASGNIASYLIISEISNGDIFTTIVSAQVSPENIVKIMKSKGYAFEINGNLYAQNITKEKFYKEQEKDAIKNFFKTWENIQLFDFDIKIAEPLSKTGNQIEVNSYGNYKYDQISYYSGFKPLSFFNKDLDKTLYGDKRKTLKYIYFSANASTYYRDELETEGKMECYSDRFRFHAEEVYPGEYEYFITVLFIPRINNNYINFVKAFVALFNSLSIKESLNSYEQLNGKANAFFLETANNLDKPDLNTFKRHKFYLRNNFNHLSAINLTDRATALNFTETSLINLTYHPIIFISETQNRVGDKNVLHLRNYPKHTNNSTMAGGEAFGYDPSILLVRLTFEELKKLKKLDFKIKN